MFPICHEILVKHYGFINSLKNLKICSWFRNKENVGEVLTLHFQIRIVTTVTLITVCMTRRDNG